MYANQAINKTHRWTCILHSFPTAWYHNQIKYCDKLIFTWTVNQHSKHWNRFMEIRPLIKQMDSRVSFIHSRQHAVVIRSSTVISRFLDELWISNRIHWEKFLFQRAQNQRSLLQTYSVDTETCQTLSYYFCCSLSFIKSFRYRLRVFCRWLL